MDSSSPAVTRSIKKQFAFQRSSGVEARQVPTLARHTRITPNLWLGGMIIAVIVLIAVFAPLLTPNPPDRMMVGPRLAPPSLTFPFGTDSLGRDMFSRVAHGARLALWTMFLGVGVAAAIGIVPGLVAGYMGGWIDQTLSRGMDIGLAFPGLLLSIIIVARLGPSLDHAVIALSIASAPSFFRIVRAQTISARKKEYVEAAHAIGASDARVLFYHIAPNIMSSLIVVASTRAGMLLLASGGMSFVGLGAQPPSPEWGTLLASGRNYMDAAPWLVILPGLCVTATVIGANLLGDGLRDWLTV